MSTATPTENDTLELVDALAELRERHGLAAVSYSTLWGACVAGNVPGKRLRGKWFMQRPDLPQVAATLAGGRRTAARAKPSERTPAAA